MMCLRHPRRAQALMLQLVLGCNKLFWKNLFKPMMDGLSIEKKDTDFGAAHRKYRFSKLFKILSAVDIAYNTLKTGGANLTRDYVKALKENGQHHTLPPPAAQAAWHP